MRLTPRIALLLAAAGVSSFAQTTENPKPIPASIPPEVRNTNQFQRFWHNYSIRSNAQNQVPDNVLAPAANVMNQAVALPLPGPLTAPAGIAGKDSTAIRATVPANAQFKGNRWKGLGPAPINGGQIGRTLPTRPMAGRMTAIAVDPTNPNRWLAGGAQGGVWETRDSGQNWVALTDALPSLSVGAIAFAPSNPRVIYIGSGEPNNSADSYGGQGLFRSTDGGLNWTQVSTTFRGGSFSDLWVDPANTNILIATINGGVFGRIAFAPPVAPVRGVYRSTDGGVTWTAGIGAPATAGGYTLLVNPANKQQVLAAFSNRAGGASATNGVYRSTDNGVNWSLIANGPWVNNAAGTGRTEMAMSPSNPSTVYVSVERTASNSGGLAGLWRTDNVWDANPTWTQISLTPTDDGTGTLGYCGYDAAFASASRQCWYSHVLAVDPANPNVLYAGGVPLWKYDGTTWTEVSKTTPAAAAANGIHVDQHVLVFAGSRLVIGNDGGIWSSTDGGATMLNHNQGLSTIQFYEGAVSTLITGNRYLGGTQDNGTPVSDGGVTWDLFFGGDGAATSISTTNANNFFFSSQNLNLFRFANNAFTRMLTGLTGTASFISKVEQCAANPNVVVAGNSNYQSRTDFYTAGADSGGNVTPGWPAVTRSVPMGSGVSALGFGGNCNNWAVASRGFSVLATTDGGTTFTNLRNSYTNPRPVSDFAYQPGNDSILWATLSAFNEDSAGQNGHVVRYSGIGTGTITATLINTGVNLPHNSIVIDPGNPNVIYVGTDMGVLRSLDAGATWQPMGPQSGMPNVAVHDLKFHGGSLVAFTHGRGAFLLASYDLNSDNNVDCVDYNIVRAAFGKRTGQAGYSTTADLNNDGVVDIRDLRMIGRQLTTSCPTT